MTNDDDHIETIERANVALKITVSELEEQLVDARRKLAELEQADMRGAERYTRIVETALRTLGASEVRFWGAPWGTGLTGSVSVTITLRDGRGEVHGDTLGGAIKRAGEVSL